MSTFFRLNLYSERVRCQLEKLPRYSVAYLDLYNIALKMHSLVCGVSAMFSV